MTERQLINSSASSATGDWVGVKTDACEEVLVVITVASAGTVTLQGKLLSDATAVTIGTPSTATEGFVAQAFPFMRVTTSDVSGGAVRATIKELRT